MYSKISVAALLPLLHLASGSPLQKRQEIQYVVNSAVVTLSTGDDYTSVNNAVVKVIGTQPGNFECTCEAPFEERAAGEPMLVTTFTCSTTEVQAQLIQDPDVGNSFNFGVVGQHLATFDFSFLEWDVSSNTQAVFTGPQTVTGDPALVLIA